MRQGESPTGAASNPTWTGTGAVATGGMGTASSATASSTGTTTGTDTTTVAQYGQCGGIGYTGSTVCASGFTCTVSSEYYSQCL